MSTTPTKKTRKKATSNRSDDEDLITPVRERIAKVLKPNVQPSDDDLGNVTVAIQELLDTNNKLMRDCQEAIELDGQKLLPSTLVTRRDFGTVEVRCSGDTLSKGIIAFNATRSYEMKEFDITPLVQLPDELIIFRTETYKSGLIKYDILFERSHVLHLSLLPDFLAVLRRQLVSVNSCLDRINEWLNKPDTNMPFIEQAFGSKSVMTAERDSRSNPVCINCGLKFVMHKMCKGTNGLKDSVWCLGTNSIRTKFRRSCNLQLQVFHTDARIDKTYNLSDANERAKLLKLVAFVSHE